MGSCNDQTMGIGQSHKHRSVTTTMAPVASQNFCCVAAVMQCSPNILKLPPNVQNTAGGLHSKMEMPAWAIPVAMTTAINPKTIHRIRGR